MRHFAGELEQLRQLLWQMGALVETAIQRSVRALVDGDRALAEAVIRDEPRINELEMKTDYESTRLLSLYQPVARDLRFLTVALKISKDLERVGDIAVNIAERVFSLLEQPPVTLPADLPKLAHLAESMLLRSLDAFMNGDDPQARAVLASDDEADQLRDSIYSQLVERMQTNTEAVRPATDLIFIACHLERIGDHATNIAEDVVYMVKGVEIRHQWEAK